MQDTRNPKRMDSLQANTAITKAVFMLLSGFLFLCLSFSAVAICESSYKNKTLTRDQIIALLESNAKLNLCYSKLDGIDLSNLELEGANFEGASLENSNFAYSNLTKANFANANLDGANFKQSFLRWSNLTNANFRKANLNHSILKNSQMGNADFSRASLKESDLSQSQGQGARFFLSRLTKTNLSKSDFTKADFSYSFPMQADFSQSILNEVDFTEAKLKLSNFSNARLPKANFNKSDLTQSNFTMSVLEDATFYQTLLSQTKYVPDPNTIPDIASLAMSIDFESVDFYRKDVDAPQMVALQTAYRKAGIRQMERLVTAMIKKARMNDSLSEMNINYLDGFVNYLFFYLSCDFGLAPKRPILIIILLWLCCGLMYRLSLKNSSNNTIYIEWKSRFHGGHFIKQASKMHFASVNAISKQLTLGLFSLYFSLLSTFRIGWDDFNIANWLSLIQKKDYSLFATGWVRSLSGLQSLVSAYLLILWLLIYFARPFDW